MVLEDETDTATDSFMLMDSASQHLHVQGTRWSFEQCI